METPSGSPAKKVPRSFLRRKASMSMAMPTLLTLYILGAGIALVVCTRTFHSFHIYVGPESQAPAQLPVHESGVLEVLEALQSPAHNLPDVDNISRAHSVNASSSLNSSVESSVSHATNGMDVESEPKFMQKPVLRMNTAKAEDLQFRLKRMTTWERRRWLTDHWSTFQILKVDNLSRQFHDRMQRFFCSSDQTPNNVTGPAMGIHNILPRLLLSEESNTDKMDERKICVQESPAFCKQRFLLTWMSPLSSFTPRERLTLESIFKYHPHACVVILSRTLDSAPGRKLLTPFVTRGYRVMSVTPDLDTLFTRIPAATWLQRLRNGTGDPGCINLMQNLSNLMRLAALYKYGGVYLDTDVVVLKAFEGLRNVVGTQSEDAATGKWRRLNNAVMMFDRAHPIVLELMKEFVDTFDGSRWGWNGPYLVSRVVEKVMQVERWENCSGVSVLPLRAFYPVNWIDVVHFFQRPSEERPSKWQEQKLEWMRQGSYAIHLWNTKSNFLKVEQGSIMETLFKQSCLFCKVAEL